MVAMSGDVLLQPASRFGGVSNASSKHRTAKTRGGRRTVQRLAAQREHSGSCLVWLSNSLPAPRSRAPGSPEAGWSHEPVCGHSVSSCAEERTSFIIIPRRFTPETLVKMLADGCYSIKIKPQSTTTSSVRHWYFPYTPHFSCKKYLPSPNLQGRCH
jgi:hypothetical protein